ncbi:hypothetical protein ACJ73_02576 [Blastomyces percursus]|uniref:Uncharacterized protein n=1 Tax=Blastomyces percursus TaxID=1658174 RepID=A0A1J9RC13_9EURO|nr:hypothetical protein ACJ73_02576 [Blastomyces percursus]
MPNKILAETGIIAAEELAAKSMAVHTWARVEPSLMKQVAYCMQFGRRVVYGYMVLNESLL